MFFSVWCKDVQWCVYTTYKIKLENSLENDRGFQDEIMYEIKMNEFVKPLNIIKVNLINKWKSSVTMFSQIVLLLSAFIYVVSATARRGTIKGRLDLAASNITGFVSTRTSFKLYQIGNFSTEYPYTSTTMFQDDEGNFEFANLPLNDGVNETTYYVMYPASMDFNLKPNRILIEFKNLENGTLQLNAFKNFWKRIFPIQRYNVPRKITIYEGAPLYYSGAFT